MRLLVRALGVSLVLACAACASLSSPAPDAPVAASAPSPRADCAPAEATIYFTENSATVQPLSIPLLRDLLDRARACEAAGGEIRAITIAAHPDHGADRTSAEMQVRERARRVRGELIDLGAPADKIQIVHIRRRDGAPMTRRAVVRLDLY